MLDSIVSPFLLKIKYVLVFLYYYIFKSFSIVFSIFFAAHRSLFGPCGHPIMVMSKFVDENMNQLECFGRSFIKFYKIASLFFRTLYVQLLKDTLMLFIEFI